MEFLSSGRSLFQNQICFLDQGAKTPQPLHQLMHTAFYYNVSSIKYEKHKANKNRAGPTWLPHKSTNRTSDI
jgi:hypothetical protein